MFMSSPPATRATAAPAPDAPGRQMAHALGRLLNGARGSREVLPHLAALERGLRSHGSAAIGRIPKHWLGRIASQLASLPLPAEEVALHDLLKRLSDRLDEGMVEWAEPSGYGSFDPQRTLVIREISHSEFMVEAQAQATTTPIPLLQVELNHPK
jgi:hypothetical protein